MILNLEPYRVNTPYPEVRNLRQDQRLLAMLRDGYSGAASETTTVMQYAYHSLRCRKRFGELSDVMRGIFYVETIHMELLGQCLCLIGENPRYHLSVADKTLCWQATLVEYEDNAAKMLMADLQGEKGAAAFYEECAADTSQPEAAALFARLAEDEQLHVQMLTELYRRTFR